VGEDMQESTFVNKNIESHIKIRKEMVEVPLVAFCWMFSPLGANQAAHVKRKAGRWLEAW